MNLEIPKFVLLADGSTANVRAVAARVIDGRLDQIVYTVEKASGAWTEIASEEVQRSTRSEENHDAMV